MAISHALLSLIITSFSSAVMAQDGNWWAGHSQIATSQQVITNQAGEIDNADLKPGLIKSILVRLKSPDVNTRIAASRDMVYGKGISDKDVYTEVAKALEYSISNPNKSSDNEVAWHALALASSGDAAYLPVLENLVNLKITRHAQRARDELVRNVETGSPFSKPANVGSKTILISESQSQSPSCQFISQETCNTSRGEAKCIAWHQDRAGKMGANSLLLINSSTTSKASVTTFVPVGNNFMAVGGTSKKTTLIANYYSCDL
jgi:hypothetical protein